MKPLDIPTGRWVASVPRGKCRLMPTPKERYPMLLVPLRLESTDEEGDEFEKALGAEILLSIVFAGDDNPRLATLSRERLLQLCGATAIDLDLIPRRMSGTEDLDPFVRALEGKQLVVQTRRLIRRDTGKPVTDVCGLEKVPAERLWN